MAKKDWASIGEEIRDLVQDAVERQDFSQLSNTISGIVNQAADGVADMVNQAAGGVQDAIHDSVKGLYSGKRTPYVEGKWKEVPPEEDAVPGHDDIGTDSETYREYGRNTDYHTSADRIRRNLQHKEEERKRTGADLVPRRTTDLVAGNAMKWLGFGSGALAGLAFGAMAAIGNAQSWLAAPGGLLLLAAGAGVGIGAFGTRKSRLVHRFRQYLGLMGHRAYISLQELADGTGRSVAYVRKDLKKMVRKGFFPQAYLDQAETTLMIDTDSYNQYMIAQKEYERRLAGEDASETDSGYASSGEPENMSEEVRALIREGKRYIRHVRECNDLIPGEEMSGKLDRLEKVITRIFDEVEHRPQLAGELRRMMSYYLPTTEKLLDAYVELDSQPVRGANMDKTRNEIEESLDTINAAFERLLDSFFQDKAWDISSDISVLNTMFAQEGLTGGKDFEEK